jgi:hypothetical protein
MTSRAARPHWSPGFRASPVLIEVITAAVTPAGALPVVMVAPTALITASPWVARASLRRK